MTDKETTTESLQEELKKCHEENTAKSEFLSMVTHQLRTPLSGNKWAFKMLLDGDLGELTSEQHAVIKKGAEATNNMIELLKEIIRANQNETWDFQYDLTKTDMQKVLNRLIDEFQESASAQGVTLKLKETEDRYPLIEIDTEKVSFAIQNLLENAIKYSAKGDTVTITLGMQDEHLMITVADQGIGIPEEQQSEIFQKFFRANNAKERKKEGTGLGLFTAKKIIERHHGDIWFESKPDKGTAFFIKLPQTQPEK